MDQNIEDESQNDLNFGSQEIIDNKFSHLEQNVESNTEEETENDLNNKEIVESKFFQEEQIIETNIEEESVNLLSNQEIVDCKYPQNFIGEEKSTEITLGTERDDTIIDESVDKIDEKSDLSALLDYALASDNEMMIWNLALKKMSMDVFFVVDH